MEWGDLYRDALQQTLGRSMLGMERLSTGVTFNLFDKRMYSNPYPAYARLREKDPVHRSRLVEGWVLTRYDDILEVLHDPRFSADESNQASFEKMRDRMRKADLWDEEGLGKSLLRSDAPDHTRLRKLVSKAFTPNSIRRLAPRIESLVAEHLDQVASSGDMDVIEDIATPLPVTVIAEMIGVPAEDRARFKHWSNEMAASVGFSGRAEARRAMKASRALRAYFKEVADQRRREPRDDLMSGLLAAEEEGDRLSSAEVFTTLELLLVAGNETTTNLIGNGTLALLQNPDQLEALRADPSRIDRAIDELLRYDAPVQATGRIVLEDMEFRGKSLKKGQNVIVLLGSANRDPVHFPDPDRLDISRPDGVHLAFGHGVHFCLGSNLARLEARSAIAALIERFGNMKLAVDEPRWRPNLFLHGLESLPVRF